LGQSPHARLVRPSASMVELQEVAAETAESIRTIMQEDCVLDGERYRKTLPPNFIEQLFQRI
jgi:hypothetical protein